MRDLVAAFDHLDALLVRAGWHRTSDWWRATVRRFLRSKARTLVARVGRRGGKSATLCRLAVALGVFVDHPIPKGDVGVIAFVSSRMEEATARLFTIRKILDAIGVKYRERGNSIELVNKPIRFTVYPCTVAGASGFTSIAVIWDEVSKWRDADTGANPATEVIAALRPTMATQPHARMVLSSSPFGTLDAHAVAFARGDAPDQLTAHAPTWEANPTITEEKTHALEPNERIWRREYAAIPGDAESSFLSSVDVRACVDAGVASRPPVGGTAYVLAMDAAFRADCFAVVVALREYRSRPGAPPIDLIVVDAIHRWTPQPGQRLDFDQCMERVASIATKYNEARVVRDAFAGDAVGSALAVRGVRSNEMAMSSAAQWERWSFVEQIVRTAALRLPDDPATIRELSELRLKLRQSGLVQVAAPERKGAHDDVADCIALGAWIARTLVASGDIEAQTRVHWDEMGITVNQRWFTRRNDGVLVPSDPPPGTWAARQAREERLAQGFITPSDPEWNSGGDPFGVRVVDND